MNESVMDTADEPLLPAFEDEALFLLLPPDELKKRVKTGASLRRLERLREAIAMLLPVWPLRDISAKLGVSQETLISFAAAEAEKVGASTQHLKLVYRSKSLRWAALAQLKEGSAQFRDLVLASKLFADITFQLEATGLVGEEKVINTDRDRQQAAATIRRMMEGLAGQNGAQGPEDKKLLPANPLSTSDLQGAGAAGGAGTELEAQTIEDGGRGGVGGAGAPNHPDGLGNGEILPKGSSL